MLRWFLSAVVKRRKIWLPVLSRSPKYRFLDRRVRCVSAERFCNYVPVLLCLPGFRHLECTSMQANVSRRTKHRGYESKMTRDIAGAFICIIISAKILETTASSFFSRFFFTLGIFANEHFFRVCLQSTRSKKSAYETAILKKTQLFVAVIGEREREKRKKDSQDSTPFPGLRRFFRFLLFPVSDFLPFFFRRVSRRWRFRERGTRGSE